MAIRVINPGFLTTIQDLGRYGYAHLGISPAGAADQLSFRLANLLVGNKESAPALEMTLLGATLQFEERTVIALSGADCDCKLGNCSVPSKLAVEVGPGATLTCGAMRAGVRTYLAVQGGLGVAPVMGSAATHLAGHFGGIEGRKLKSGDWFRVGNQQLSPARSLRPSALKGLYSEGPIRVTRGPQREWFGPEAFENLFSSVYAVSEQSNRSGLRLKGPSLHPLAHSELLTDGIPLGAIQVPRNGQPIILFVDQQTTGGYPKIANVIAADLHRVGQLRPRDEVRFAEVSLADAVRLLREQELCLRRVFA